MYFSFPGATHTRVEHSIGVGFLATKFLQFLKEHYNLEVDEKDVIILWCAGILHDFGHPHLGHALDGITGTVVSMFRRRISNFPIFPGKLDKAITLYVLLEDTQVRLQYFH